MKTISLQALIREPLKVKRWTAAGDSVQVTENGRLLWIIQPASSFKADEVERRQAIDEIFDESSSAKPSKISLSRILLESRR
jgi:hypothetical protein